MLGATYIIWGLAEAVYDNDASVAAGVNKKTYDHRVSKLREAISNYLTPTAIYMIRKRY